MNVVDQINSLIQKEEKLIIGLMSGMSMDGVDLALVRIKGDFPNAHVKLLDSYYMPYPEEHIENIRLLRTQGSTQLVSTYNVLIANIFATCVNTFLSEKKISSNSIDAIGSHGQTIFHCTDETKENNSTLQIGSGAIIAEKTGILTVSNFRERDIAQGGTGAPLVPLADYFLSAKPGRILALNNLGSISNVTVVSEKLEDVLAFDIGPANMPIDYFVRKASNGKKSYDEDGGIAASGSIISQLLDEMMKSPFLKKEPPRAAGYSEFGPEVLEKYYQKYSSHSTEDLVRTATEFSIRSTAECYTNFILPRFPKLDEVIFSGGGAKNSFFMARLKEELPDITVSTLDPELNDAKEALAFAILAHELLHGRNGNIPHVTGAQKPVLLGDISPA